MFELSSPLTGQPQQKPKTTSKTIRNVTNHTMKDGRENVFAILKLSGSDTFVNRRRVVRLCISSEDYELLEYPKDRQKELPHICVVGKIVMFKRRNPSYVHL